MLKKIVGEQKKIYKVNNMENYIISLINFIRILINFGIPVLFLSILMAKRIQDNYKINKWDIVKIIISLFLLHDFIFFVYK
jgi:hypothetical protein